MTHSVTPTVGPPMVFPPSLVHIRLNISGTVLNPTPKPDIIVPCNKTHSVILTIGPPGYALPLQFI